MKTEKSVQTKHSHSYSANTSKLRMMVFASLFAAFLAVSTDPSAVTCGIERMLRPVPLSWLGISSYELATMMNISIAIFPILFDRFERTKAAQTARGMDFV